MRPAIRLAALTLVAAGTLVAPGAEALQPSLAWIAHLGGRPLDIYATAPSANQLLGTGLSMVQGSIAAYKSTAGARVTESARAHYRVRRFLSTTSNTQVLYVDDNRALVIAIRGSQENADWVTDGMQVITVGIPTGVHIGFNAAAATVLDDVYAEASAAVGGGKQIWLTGHSLGGAVAQILAYRLAKNSVSIAGVHTFGSPAVGDLRWAQAYDAILRNKTHRWVNEDDPVPCYPGSRQDWEQAGRQHVLSDSNVVFDSTMEQCEDHYPTITAVCEPDGWWAETLLWVTGAQGICTLTSAVSALHNLVLDLQSNPVSRHASDLYRNRIAIRLPGPLVDGLLLP